MPDTQTNLLVIDRAISFRYWDRTFAADLASLRAWSSNAPAIPSYATDAFDEERTITTTSYQWPLSPARDNYMGQMIGYLTAPETGFYRFAIASDDHSILYLGTTDQRSSKREICYYNGATGRWNTGAQLANQQSALIYLEAGRRYYLEAVYRDGTGGDGVSVFWQTPSGPPLPTVNQSVQASTEPFLIPAQYLSTFATPPVAGAITFRVWYSSFASDLGSVTIWSTDGNSAHANDLFTEERTITTASYPWNLTPGMNHYTGQMIGYLTPPETGNYKFAIASDDHSILYLGTNHLRAGKREICNYNGSTGRWNVGAQLANQQSALIPLEAGKRYYIEAVYRDGTGSDGVSLFWQTPSGLPLPTANTNVQANTEPFLISTNALSTVATPGVVFLKTDLAVAVSAPESTRPTLRVVADGTRPYAYQWFRDGLPITGATAASYTLPYVQPGDDNALFHVVVTNNFSSVTSTVAALTVTADPGKPWVISVGSLFKQTIEVRMSEPVTAASATATANYQLWNSTGAVVAVTGAIQDPTDAARITLQTDPLPETDLMRLAIRNLTDLSAAANVMDPQTNVFRANNFDTLARVNNTQPYGATAVGDHIFMTGGGSDIWGNADRFTWLYKTVTGNFDYRVKGVYLPSINSWCKMGPMARASEAAGARNVISCFTPQTIFKDVGQNTYSPQVRDTTGGASTSSDVATNPLGLGLQAGQAARPAIAYPSWLRLQRVGNNFYFHRSTDGTNWTFWTWYDSAASPEGPLPATLQVGLALTGHDTARTADGILASFSVVDDGPLRFTLTPTNNTVVESGTAIFACAVAGNTPWFFQWSSNGVPILGATSNALTITQVPFAANGATISVLVTNLNGDSITASAMLYVQGPDFTKPTVATVGSLFKGTVEVYFSEAVTDASAVNLANYTLLDSTGAPVDIYYAQQDYENPSHVTLATAPMPETDRMRLACRGLVDRSLAANTMDPQTNGFRANNFDSLERVNNTQAYAASAVGEEIRLTAGGADIWGASDQFAWLYKTVSGDFDYAVRGLALPAVNTWSKMGLMARVSSGANARNGYLCFTPATGQGTYSPQVRETSGAATTSSDVATGAILYLNKQPGLADRPALTYPSWVRLQRVGNSLYYYYGAHGTNWTFYTWFDSSTSAEGPLPYDLQLGLALTSHDTAQTVNGVMGSFTQLPGGPLRFELEPVSVTIEEGDSTAFTTRVAGRSPFYYQWMKNGEDIANATTTVLALARVPITESGSTYAVRVWNPFGETITSSNAVLTVIQDTNKPVAYAVGSLRGAGVGVYFRDLNRIDPVSAGNPLNYLVNGGTVGVTAATVEPDLQAVMLALSAPISGAFSVTIQNVADGAPIPNVIAPVTLSSAVVHWPMNQDVGTPNANPPPAFTDPVMPGFVQAIGTEGYYVHAGGHDIWDAADGMHFAYQPVTGNFDVSVRVAALLRPNEWSKAGLMVREELAADARNCAIITAPTNGQNLVNMQWRATKAGASVSLADAVRPRPSPIPNCWLRATRTNQNLTFYYGVNGTAWTTLFTTNLAAGPYPSTVYVGLATTSHDNGATLTNVTSAYYFNVAGLEPPPTLSVVLSGANVVISWSTSKTTFQLQGSPDVAPVNWQPVGVTPVVSGQTYTVTVPATGPHRYFRLIQP